MKLSKANLIPFIALVGLMSSCGGVSSSVEESSSLSVIESSSSEVISSSSEEISSEIVSSRGPISVADPLVIELKEAADAKVTKLIAPFSIYTEEGEEPSLTKDFKGESSKNIPTSYENMYAAIRTAGYNSTSKKKLQVQDANNVRIFLRDKKSVCYLFDGPDYIGTCFQGVAKEYCLAHPESYAIDGNASDYYYLGRRDMVKGQSVQEAVLETPAGAYNYMFSKAGSGGKDYGYRYCTADLRLSETTYKRSTDGCTWNAYIFINMSGGILADLGLIGSMWGSEMCWKLVRNCSSNCHGDSKFFVYQDEKVYPNCTVTKATKYDAKTGVYSGFDDLHFEAFIRNNGWTLNITNLTTGVVSTLEDSHFDGTTPIEENANPVSGRALIAASYCPVTGNVWNWNCGAFLKDVVWENISLKKTIVDDQGQIDQDIEHYRELSTSYDFYPGEDCYRDGYSQGGYKAYHEYATHKEDGTYKSGATYKAGSRYLSYSVDYSEN